MGEIANSMIRGEVCGECGVYLEPNETVYAQNGKNKKLKMPKNGEAMGFPVLCEDCK